MTTGTPTIAAGPDEQELGRLELEVGAREVAGQVRAEVALLDDLVEAGERLALGDQLGDAALTGRRAPCSGRSAWRRSARGGRRCPSRPRSRCRARSG